MSLYPCVRVSPSQSLLLSFSRSKVHTITGESCSTDDSCRFEYDLCVDGICKVNPSVQEDVSVKTTVSVSANAYDTRLADNDGCRNTGCLPELARDSITKVESR